MTTTTTVPGIVWDTKAIRIAHDLIRAVDHKLRHRMLDFLDACERPPTVTEVYIKMRLEQSVASQHLAILRRAKLISGKRQGKNVVYSINYDVLERAQEAVTNFKTL